MKEEIIKRISNKKADYYSLNDRDLFEISEQKIILTEGVCRSLMHLTSTKTYPTFLIMGYKEDDTIVFDNVLIQKTDDNKEYINKFFSKKDRAICYGKITNSNKFDLNHLTSYLNILDKYKSLNNYNTLSMFVSESQNLNFYKYNEDKLIVYPNIYTKSKYGKQISELPSYENRGVDKEISENYKI